MQHLNLPPFDYKLQSTATGHRIFDIVRKRYVALTPEEWVRQHFIHYLINILTYPKSLIRVEKAVKYNSLHHRADIVIYDRTAMPALLVECKAPHITLNKAVWEQMLRYNAQVGAPLLAMTNGLVHLCWQSDKGHLTALPAVPAFEEMLR